MDNPKDISVKDNKTGLITKDNFADFLSLKSEKLASALYLVTDFLSDSEPLKWKLRQLALDLVSNFPLTFRQLKGSLNSSLLDRKLSQLKDLVTLLDVARVGGNVSQMNFDILKQEYYRLAELISERLAGDTLQDFITSTDSPDTRLSSSSIFSSDLWESKKLNIKSDYSNFSNLTSPIVGESAPARFSKEERGHGPINSIGQKDNKKESVNDLYGLNSSNEKKSLRKEQIIGYLKDKTWTSINDISKILPDCGPKTVQRELLEMVSRGILKKQGERRWSRYMLATSH